MMKSEKIYIKRQTDKMQKEEVTILLPFHEKNQYLNDAIESCLNSTNCTINILLIDTRNREIARQNPLKKYENCRIILAPGKKYIDALAIGIENAETDYISIMNSDDLIAPDRIFKQLKKLDKTNSDLCITDVKKFSKNSDKAIPPLLGKFNHENYFVELLLFGSYGADATWFFTRKWAMRNEIFKCNLDSSDWATALRIFPETKICKVNESLYFYRMHRKQITRHKKLESNEIISALVIYNQKIGLPPLHVMSISGLAGFIRPKFRNYFDQISETNLEIWFDEVLSRYRFSAEEKISLKNLFSRRLLLLSFSNIHYAKYFDSKTFYSIFSDILKSRGKFRW